MMGTPNQVFVEELRHQTEDLNESNNPTTSLNGDYVLKQIFEVHLFFSFAKKILNVSLQFHSQDSWLILVEFTSLNSILSLLAKLLLIE